MSYTNREISEVALGAGYPGRNGWYIIVDPDGNEVATTQPQYAESLTEWFNSADTVASLRLALAASRDEVEKAKDDLQRYAIERNEVIDKACLAFANDVRTLAAECESLRADKERLDVVDANPILFKYLKYNPFLAGWCDSLKAHAPKGYWSIVFSHNWKRDQHPTLRAAIDAARADAARKEPPAKAHGCEVGE